MKTIHIGRRKRRHATLQGPKLRPGEDHLRHPHGEQGNHAFVIERLEDVGTDRRQVDTRILVVAEVREILLPDVHHSPGRIQSLSSQRGLFSAQCIYPRYRFKGSTTKADMRIWAVTKRGWAEKSGERIRSEEMSGSSREEGNWRRRLKGKKKGPAGAQRRVDTDDVEIGGESAKQKERGATC